MLSRTFSACEPPFRWPLRFCPTFAPPKALWPLPCVNIFHRVIFIHTRSLWQVRKAESRNFGATVRRRPSTAERVWDSAIDRSARPIPPGIPIIVAAPGEDVLPPLLAIIALHSAILPPLAGVLVQDGRRRIAATPHRRHSDRRAGANAAQSGGRHGDSDRFAVAPLSPARFGAAASADLPRRHPAAARRARAERRGDHRNRAEAGGVARARLGDRPLCR